MDFARNGDAQPFAGDLKNERLSGYCKFVWMGGRHLLLVGAYRTNEIGPSHPLLRTFDAIRKAGAPVQEINLAPLAREDLDRLVADTLSCGQGRAARLAQMVREKTGGNPFFVIQFISALAEEGLLRFDHEAARWHWELDRVHAKGYTDNVVDLMVGKLTRLPVETQEALQQLACLGNVAETTMLSIVLGKSNEEIDSDLWEAVRLELVKPSDGSYRFTHDRVQEAAYSLTPNQLRAEAHLLIGRLLALHTPAEKREEAVFEIVSQLNRGAALITSPDERQQLGELNLLAGRRARATTAYASALTYLTAGAALLPEDSWERGRELRFALELHRAECEFLTGALAEAEQRLAALSTRAATTVERATVACLRVDLYTTLDQSSRAIAVGLDYLRHLGMEWSPHPTEAEARHEYQRIWPQLESRPIEALIELSLMTDPASLATLEVLIKIGPAAFYTDANLLALVTCRAVNLSLERGNCDASCVAYAYLGIIAGPRFGDYQAGYRFGRLGYDLVERRGLTRFQARIYMDFGNVVLPWTRHVREGRELVRRAFEVANKVGDLTYAAYCGNELNTNLLAAGDPLAEVEREARRGLEFATNAKFGFVVDCIATQLGLIRTLRGLTPTFGCFDDEQFDEHLIERRFADNPDLAFVECWYWVRKLQGRFFAGDHVSAIEASSRAQRLLWTSPSYFEKAEYQFYTALSQAALCDAAPAQQRQQLLDALTDHHRQLTLWATNCPDNFANRAALVGAEIARIDGRDVDAMQLYEQAIQSAHAHGFVHNEGLADELAARYYAARGFRKISETYLKDARDCYLRWGAEGKVRQLDQQHPHLRPAPPPLTPTTTLDAPVEQLDVGTMLKASQALSGEIVFATLIQTLMRIAVEHAGAERGILFLLRKGEPQIAAEAATNRGEVEVALREKLVLRPEFPESAAHYVVRTRNKLIVEDALVSPLLSNDEYVRRRQSRSVLCLPIVKQAELVGVLLLENNLAPGVFTPDRITVLELLASQAAISLENAYLYSDLKRNESFLAEGQRMSRTGSWSWNLATGKVTWSEEHFRIFGHTAREQPEPTFEWFLERIHPEDRPFLEHRLAMAVRQSREFALDFRIVLPDRSTKHVHGVGRPIVEESGAVNEYIGTTIDVSERKRSEDELRKAQADLARVTRLTTMGELAASIAHEVNQPLMAIVNNAESCLIRLATEQPDLDKARKAAERIVKNGHRASDILRSIRAMVGKSSPEMTSLDINGVIENILDLMRAELHQHDVLLETELFTGLEPVSGDRVQLQQVILNLVKNGIEATSEIRDRQRMLRVVTRPDADGNVLTAVEDSGIGFDPAKIDRIFEPLFTTKREGMGMGLSICRSIIEAHGGRLRATPRLPFGSIFQFTLPPTQRGFN